MYRKLAKYMMSKTWILLVVIALISFIGVYGCQKHSSQGEDPVEINIAGNIPLTGPIASFSGQYHNGFAMGIDDASKSLNIPRDKFKVDFQDNAGQPKTAVTVMQKQFLFELPQVYISGTSAMSDAIVSEVSKKEIPHFLVSFDAFMTHGNPKVFRILPNFKIEAPLFLDFIKSKKAKRVFFFTPNLKAYLEQSDKLIIPEIKKLGIEYQRELFEFEQKDYRTIALKASKFGPDVVVVSGYAFHVYPIIKALREYNLVRKSAVIATLDYIDLLHGDIPKEDLKGVFFTSPECEIPGRIPSFEQWRNGFKEGFGKPPSYVDAYAYDTARILVSAYKEAGKIDSNSIKSIMPFDGIVGMIELDEERDLKSTLVIGFFNEKGIVEEYKASD